MLYSLRQKATDRVATPPTRAGRPTAWFVGDEQIGSLGAVIQTGWCINDEAELDFAEAMEDVRHGTYRPDTATEELEIDGMWGAVVQSSQAYSRTTSTTQNYGPAPFRRQRLDRRLLICLPQ